MNLGNQRLSLIYSARMTDNKDFRTRYGHRAHLLDNSMAQYPHCIQYCMKQQYPCRYVKSLYTLDYMTQLLIIVLKSKKEICDFLNKRILLRVLSVY